MIIFQLPQSHQSFWSSIACRYLILLHFENTLEFYLYLYKMSETSLKFGPEWLRALSHGGNLSSPPSSPGPVKFKLAEYRYGREEMLALFCKEYSPPDGLHNLGTLCIEEVQEPLAFLPMNPEEHRIWQRCVNSDAVLRSAGRAAPLNGVGRGRGGSIDRGRGKGVGAPYYSRGISYDEEADNRGPRETGPPGMGMRAKVFERSQSVSEARGWVGERGPSERGPTERGPSERGPGSGIEERGGAVSPRKEPPRSFTDNWRSRGGLDEEGDRWRALTNTKEKWVGRGAWRERENGAEGEWEESRGPNGASTRASRPPWESDRDKEGHRRQWEDDNLPEWVTENAEDKGGSFDATGAFHAPGSSDEDERSEFPPEKTNPLEEKPLRHDKEKRVLKTEENGNINPEEHEWNEERNHENHNEKTYRHEYKIPGNNEMAERVVHRSSPLVNGLVSDDDSSLSQSPSRTNESKIPTSTPPHLHKIFQVEDDKLEHMQSAADDLVAKLVEDDEPRPVEDSSQLNQPPPGVFIPTERLSLPDDQWYYTDPQGDIQGPFSSADMAAWCKAGYFKPDLLLRRLCDDKFAQLGDLTTVFGRIPFLPGPPVPPLKVSELLNAQKLERERAELMSAYHLQKQLHQQQTTLRQQQVLQQLQSLDEWSNLNTGQQQQLFVQHMMSLPPLVPPTLPAGLQGSTSTISSSPSSQPPTGLDHRPTISSVPPKHDPIQAFVAQMSTTAPNIPSAVASEPTVPSPPSSSSGSMNSESPLQKLLLQLQRGSQQQSTLANSLTSSSITSASHPSNLGSIPTNSIGLEKPPEQFDAIQSLMSQLSKMQIQNTDPLQQDELKQREGQKRIEEDRKLFEEQKRAEEERMRLQEIRLQEERIKEDERRKELEEKNRRLEEELKRIQEEHSKRRREEDSKYKHEEKRKQEQQKSTELKKEEDQKRNHIKQKQKQLEEENRLEEVKKRKLEEDTKKLEEEKKKKEEKEKQQQVQMQEEMRRIALEEERRRMQQLEEEERRKTTQEEQIKRNQLLQLQKAAVAAQEKLKQVPPAWSSKIPEKEVPSAPSLAEIQRAQEIKERKEREAETQRENQRQKEAQRQATEEKKQKEANLKWAARVGQSTKAGGKSGTGQPSQPPVKSLLEIQKEEEKELKKRLEKEQAERAATISHLSLNAAGVWGSTAQSLSWANRASTGATPNVTSPNSQASQPGWSSSNSSNTLAWSAVAQNSTNSQANTCWNSDGSTWSQPASQTSGGFWESSDSIKSSAKPVCSTGSNANLSPIKNNTYPQGNNKNASSQAVTSNNKVNKKKSKDDSENVKKLFADSVSPADSFTQWCKTALHSMKVHASIDIPTFVGFLADVESPYEVHDYIRSYLGDSKEVKEFAKQYLDRRSKARNAQKEEHEDDNILAPAPAVNPVSTLEFQEVKTRLKKGKKKMQKVDNSILGFNVSSLERVFVEEGN